MSNNHRGGSANSKLTRAVIDFYGPVCWLQLPGCTKRATTKDHVIPKDFGGDDSMENLRPACNNCNGRRSNLAISGTPGGITVVVIVGPPAAGKSTHVREHARAGDIVIDLDRIAAALMPGDRAEAHDYPNHVRNIAIGARQAAIHRALRTNHTCTVWLIHAVPKRDQLQQYARLRYQIVTLDPGREIVEQRARTARPRDWMQGVARWYHAYPEGPASIERVISTRPIASHQPREPAPTDLAPSRAW